MNGVTDSTAEDDVALDWRERLARPAAYGPELSPTALVWQRSEQNMKPY